MYVGATGIYIRLIGDRRNRAILAPSISLLDDSAADMMSSIRFGAMSAALSPPQSLTSSPHLSSLDLSNVERSRWIRQSHLEIAEKHKEIC